MCPESNTDRPFQDKGIEELREIAESLRGELSHRTTPSAKRLREEIDPNYSIDRPHDCCVYVIELSEGIRNDKSFIEKNPDASVDRPCLYVGSTWLTAEERFEDHKHGDGRFSRRVRKFGARLRPEFYGRFPSMTRERAEEEERALAELLRNQGYGVWQE